MHVIQSCATESSWYIWYIYYLMSCSHSPDFLGFDSIIHVCVCVCLWYCLAWVPIKPAWGRKILSCLAWGRKIHWIFCYHFMLYRMVCWQRLMSKRTGNITNGKIDINEQRSRGTTIVAAADTHCHWWPSMSLFWIGTRGCVNSGGKCENDCEDLWLDSPTSCGQLWRMQTIGRHCKQLVKIYEGRDSEQMSRVKASFVKFRKKWKRQNPGEYFPKLLIRGWYKGRKHLQLDIMWRLG